MKLTPILASDTTGTFLLPLMILFWVVIGGSTLAGLLSLILYFFRRVPRVVGITLGLLSTATGVGGVIFFIIFTAGVESIAWVGVLIPLVIGVVDLILWKYRRQTDAHVA